ncbi:MAG: hypothetical protein ABI131_12785 [Nostocoides sp.]
MRAAYKYLAYAIDVLILVQAAAIAWAVFGLSKWIEDGNTLTKAKLDGNTFSFTEERGFMIHGINGQMLIPLVGLVLLIISFLAKVPGGPKWAGMLFGGIVLQVVLGMTAHAVPALGFIHGFWALLLFWLAYRTAKQADVHGTAEPAAVLVAP